jgi:hypothetical protein
MAGWLRYTQTATNTLEKAGVHHFSVEIWNELTFGAAFLNINNYYPSDAPLVPDTGPGVSHAALRSGGNIWELANETNQYLKKAFGSAVTVIWGFSNTTFYNPGPSQLPAHIGGLSYHPYGAGMEPLSACVGAGARYLQGGPYIPDMTLSPAEGCEAMGFKTENLPRGALAPSKDQTQNPPGTHYLHHYITETGDEPAELGVTGNPTEAQFLKSKAALRDYSFWLNKGIDQFDWFAAFGSKTDDLGFNLLAVGSDSGGNPRTLQSRTVGHFASRFAGAVQPSKARSLGVQVRDITPRDNTSAYQVFPADPTTGEPELNYRSQFQFLPFQVTNSKFVIPVYVMSWNLVRPPPPMKFRLDITGVDGKTASVSYYDPITNRHQPVTVVSRHSSNIVIEVQAVDYPRTVSISNA